MQRKLKQLNVNFTTALISQSTVVSGTSLKVIPPLSESEKHQVNCIQGHNSRPTFPKIRNIFDFCFHQYILSFLSWQMKEGPIIRWQHSCTLKFNLITYVLHYYFTSYSELSSVYIYKHMYMVHSQKGFVHRKYVAIQATCKSWIVYCKSLITKGIQRLLTFNRSLNTYFSERPTHDSYPATKGASCTGLQATPISMHKQTNCKLKYKIN